MRRGNEYDYYEVQEFVTETNDAWKVIIENEAFWLPKSVCRYEPGDDEIEIPDWLAEERGLI